MKTDQINSETRCSLCGSKVKIGGDGETHYYIPIENEQQSPITDEMIEALTDIISDALKLDADMAEIVEDKIKTYLQKALSLQGAKQETITWDEIIDKWNKSDGNEAEYFHIWLKENYSAPTPLPEAPKQ